MAQPPNPKRRFLPLPDSRSGLPEDLLESIGQRLASDHDATSFRSACSPWRAAIPFATFGPLLLLSFDPDSDRVSFYCIPEKKVLSKTLPNVRGKVACGSLCGWLALMDEAASMTLLNPFAGARTPRVGLSPGEHVVAASSSERLSRVHDRWVLHPTNGYGDADAVGRAIKLEDMRDVFFHEIVLSAPPEAASGECVAMAMLGCSTEVAFCRVGVDSAWTLLDTKLKFSVGSIVHCQDKFLAIDCTREIFVCSNNASGATPTVTLLPSLSPPAGLCHRSYLESNGKALELQCATGTSFDVNIAKQILYQTHITCFVVASADLSLRRAEVEEKRDKVHKESKALLDYTRKAINKLTELKK
ncbi:uncharacterized protein [Miscanthus floridulus]|uniref:uncharacterized protein n=1 Tax=Miscanthus floridulus TaxID=154761 RepID=UPI00345AD96D